MVRKWPPQHRLMGGRHGPGGFAIGPIGGSSTADTTPDSDFLFSAPSATWISDAATAQAIFEILVDTGVTSGMRIFGESSQFADFSVIDETVDEAIGAPDLIDFTIENFAFAPFTDGTWYARFWTASAGGVQNSPKSTAISETISTTPAYVPTFHFLGF